MAAAAQQITHATGGRPQGPPYSGSDPWRR
jgi:hypothetical protein